MIYIFLYNVIYIKSDFSKLKKTSKAKFVLIGSDYCLRQLNSRNRYVFDHVHQISRNFQRPDSTEIELIVLDYINSYGAHNIRLLTNEDSTQIICAQLREKYNIEGHSINTILPFVNKVVSKNTLNNVVRTPRFCEFDKKRYSENSKTYLNEIIDYIQFPMFVKPVDLVSSVCTNYVPDMESLHQVVNIMMHHKYDFEIDEFIKGDLFHCDAMIINGKVEFFLVGRCSFNLSRFFDGKPVGSIPVIEKELLDRIRVFCDKIFAKLKCPDGAYHMEVFLEPSTNELVFLEIGARTGGALITNVCHKLCNINIEETNYLIQLGLIKEICIKQTEFFAGFLNFPKIKGQVLQINKPKLPINYDFVKYVEVGDVMEQATNLLDIACSIIFWDTSYEIIEQIFNYLKNYEPVKIQALMEKVA